MAQDQEPESLEYETNEKGEKMLVRSIKSNQRAYLRFTNKTGRPVDVWWRNFRGSRVHYVRLKAHTFFDINSFITHPWEFSDVTTKESYVIENKRIFRPPAHVADRGLRTNWNITIGVRSLRHSAMLAVAKRVSDPNAAFRLQLPRVIAEDLRETITLYHKAPNSARSKHQPNGITYNCINWDRLFETEFGLEFIPLPDNIVIKLIY